MKIFGLQIGRKSKTPVISINDLAQASGQMVAPTVYDGDKFYGGFGPTSEQIIDYWTLRTRSAELFTKNLYARGIIRRLVTNEINTGLTLEAEPDENVLGLEEGSLNDWTVEVESRFAIWSKEPKLCDYKRLNTFGALQRAARSTALVDGDVLVILRQSQVTKSPVVQLISGNKVLTPLLEKRTNLKKDHKIIHGVEVDKIGRHVAFWIKQDDGTFKRIPAFGEKSKRRLAWLVYGTDKRLDDVRGQPLLALVLQSLKEVDRYRDSVQRKAVLNAIVALFIKKSVDKGSTLPWKNSATKKETATVTDGDGTTRDLQVSKHIPGLVFEELQVGEEPVGFHNQGTDEKFGVFEEAIIQAVAWANEIPPEVLRLAFSNNYSASQAAINEFKMYINKVWSEWGETFCTPIYIDWLISQVLSDKIKSKGLLDVWRNPQKLDEFGAWIQVQWYGSVKLANDMLKQAKGATILVDKGWTSNGRVSRELTGTKFSSNIKRIKQENALKVDAARDLMEFFKEFGLTVDQVLAAPTGDLKNDA